MNKNKGFIGIGLVLAIILGVVVIGGGAYFLGKNANTLPKVGENNYQPAEKLNDVVNTPIQNNPVNKITDSILPTTTTKEKCVSETMSLFPKYISKGNDLVDYKVNSITFFALNDTQGAQYLSANSTKDACMVSVNYSVKPISTAYTNWTAGNGHESSGGWIVSKSGFVTLDKNSSGYYIVGMGTGY